MANLFDIAVARKLSGGGGGGGAEPLIINVNSESGVMDKTFGEIRHAFDSGRTLLVAFDDSYGNTTNLSMMAVVGCHYSITDGEYAGASGGVSVARNEYFVECVEAPYTLDALDAQYPYMT